MTDRLLGYGNGVYIDPLTGKPTLTPPRRQPLPIQPGTPAANLAIPSTGQQVQERIPTLHERTASAITPITQPLVGKSGEDIATLTDFSPMGGYETGQTAARAVIDPSKHNLLAAGLTLGTAALGARMPGANRLMNAVTKDASRTARIFLGEGSKTANLDMLRRAQTLEKQGWDAVDIWRKTGWGRNAGGDWNYRISDAASKFDPEPEIQRRIKQQIASGDKRRAKLGISPLNDVHKAQIERNVREEGFTTKLHKVFKHPELMKSEPELFKAQKFVIEPKSKQSPYLAWARPDQQEIGLSHGAFSKPEEARSSILHELDHAVAEHSGFPVGSAPQTFLSSFDRSKSAAIAKRTRDTINKMPGASWPERVQAAETQYDARHGAGAFHSKISAAPTLWQMTADAKQFPDHRLDAGSKLYNSAKGEMELAKNFGMDEEQVKRDYALKYYKNTAGEAAARNTQLTRDLTAAELQQNPPMERGQPYSYDVPLEQQLIFDEQSWVKDKLPGVYTPEDLAKLETRPEASAGPSGPRYQQLAPDLPAPNVARDLPGMEPTRALPENNIFFSFGPLRRQGAAAEGITPQVELERYRGRRPSGTTERGEGLLRPAMVNRLIPYIERGIGRGGLYWHDTEPVRRGTQAVLGESRGHENFMENMDLQGRVSPMSDVLTNIRNSSYYRWLLNEFRKGNIERLPTPFQTPPGRGNWHGEEVPEPYGHLAAALQQSNVLNLVHGVPWDIKKRPKPPSYGGNLAGNRLPWAADTMDFRLKGQLTRDPRFLTKEALNEGRTVRTARPTDWEGKPGDAEYWAAEQLGKRAAARMGLAPMHAQASQWVGGAEATGLLTDYNKSFAQLYDDVVQRTMADPRWPEIARRVGVDPNMSIEQLWRSHVKDYTPLLAIPPAVMAAGAGGQDEQRVSNNPFFEVY